MCQFVGQGAAHKACAPSESAGDDQNRGLSSKIRPTIGFSPHIKINREHVLYLGAAFEDEEGKKIYFVFDFLPFGLSSAVHCIAKLFKPINAYLHQKGIRHSIYIDDGRILAGTKREAEDGRKFTYEVLKRSGGVLEKSKSDGEGQAGQIKEYLGFKSTLGNWS